MSKSELVKSKIKTPVKLTPKEAIAILGLFSASTEAEGIIPTEEFPLIEMLEGISPFEEDSEEDFNALTTKVNTIRDENEVETLIPSAIASLTKKQDRESAYIISAILILGMDEDIPESEEEYLFELQEALKISDERAEELIDEVFEELEEEEEEEEE
ncbi:hypothetical protein WJM97_18110 [Okeanomitos corallinicola TIOX110]|uniref:Co-chaperone DjlA N-terminal domain-containing protein n=1 Tax=Okeanomitos corallinicola TIOX110 TaxID=3133117 RepID=A0ABZ2UR11_9CYAN